MVQKKLGRPLGFDPDEALMRAVEVFWAKGFDGASLGDLTAAMGINRPSLYATFEDKHGLFLAAMDAYAAKVSRQAVEAFEAEPDISAAVEIFFKTALEKATRPGGAAQGCMLGSAAVAAAGADPEIRTKLNTMSSASRARLTDRFAREVSAGALPTNFPSSVRAAMMIELMQGQAHRARIGDARAEIEAGLTDRVKAVLAT